MVFSSPAFLFAFLPVTFLLYRLIPGQGRGSVTAKNALLAVLSLVFYAFGEPVYVLLLLASVVVNYLSGLLLAPGRKGRRAVVAGSTAVNLGLLCVFKYADFAVGALNGLGLSLPLPDIALPVGISFFTFQGLSYVVDCYRDPSLASKSLLKLTLYISFFPQLIAGPIVKYHDVSQQIDSRETSPGLTADGVRRFILGLSKKLLIANTVGHMADLVFGAAPAQLDVRSAWLGALCYCLQIYFDFSGYSDMAIGLGRMFGFHFLENFNYPYISRSITEFWRRWHISLSTWFRDYVYIPMGGNRVKKSRWVLNLLAVWGLTGFWHGAQWNFILWGLYYGVILLAEKLFLGKYLAKWPKALQWVYAMFFVLLGWVIFNITDFTQMAGVLGTMFGFVPTQFTAMIAADTSIVRGLIYIPLGLVCAFPALPWVKARWARLREGGPNLRSALALTVENALCFALLLLSIIYILSAAYNYFIYFRF